MLQDSVTRLERRLDDAREETVTLKEQNQEYRRKLSRERERAATLRAEADSQPPRRTQPPSQ